MRLPDETSRAVASPELKVKPAGRGLLVMSGKPVELAMKPAHRREFIDRLFSVPQLAGLVLDATEARLLFEPGSVPASDLLRGVAKAMRSEKPGNFPMADLDLIEVISHQRPIEIWRAGNRLTFLRVKHRGPGGAAFSIRNFATHRYGKPSSQS